MTLSTTSEREAVHAAIRAAGGIVHGDGNIFFTNYKQFLSSSTVLGAEPLTAEQVVAQTTNYSMHEASIFFAGVIFAEEHHGIISPKSEQGDQQ